MLSLNLKCFTKAATVAALTLGLAFVQKPAQKASAQVNGAGTGSITTLANFVRTVSGTPAVNPGEIRYVVTDSDAAIAAFLNGETDFVASDIAVVLTNDLTTTDARDQNGNPTVDPTHVDLAQTILASLIRTFSSTNPDFNINDYVVVNEANPFIVFPYNVTFPDGTPFNAQLTLPQACGIIGGIITNWQAVGGPDLPVTRVVPGDNSGISAIFQTTFVGFVCGLSIFDPTTGQLGTVPNDNGNVIVVPPALPDPFTKANLTLNDDNSGDFDINTLSGFDLGSYSQGIFNTIAATPGAIGYGETSIAVANGFVQGSGLATNTETGASTVVALGPTFVVFRRNYTDTIETDDSGNPVVDDIGEPIVLISGAAKAADAQAACRAFTDTNNLVDAGFDPTPITLQGISLPNGELGVDAADGGSSKCNSITAQ